MTLRVGVWSLLFLIMPLSLFAQDTSTEVEIPGLWEAKLRFGPDVRGMLTIEHEGDTWRAEIAGRNGTAHLTGESIEFELPDGDGRFRGAFASGRKSIAGHWIQSSGYASPVTLARAGKTERWRGTIDPLDEALTMYLKVDPPAADGSMRAFLKNPERNFGIFTRIASLTREGDIVRLHSAARGSQPARVISEGKLDEEGTISIPLRGGTYDFRRVDDDAASDFYPRSRPGVGKDYVYRVPPLLDDGWPVAAPEKAGMSREALVKFVRMLIDTPIDSLNSFDNHGVLIARHGKLVLEEYFHGEHRDKPHDTRSAAKSVASVLYGAVMQEGAPVSEKSFVYEVMNGGTFPEGLEPRKRAMTMAHLLTMSSGLDADDNDENSKGAEDVVSERDDIPDLWKFTLDLNTVREPGEKAVYASLQADLVGGVVSTAAGRPLPELFHDLIAEPLQIQRYWMNARPSGVPYFGGGMRFLPRDFTKFGQLMVNGGTWGGHRVVSEDWVKKSTAYYVDIGKGKYGYLWWVIDYPYQGRTIRAFYAAGNGGQVVMGIPDLDVVAAFYGGNYNDRVIFQIQRRLVPEFVLPAVVGE